MINTIILLAGLWTIAFMPQALAFTATAADSSILFKIDHPTGGYTIGSFGTFNATIETNGDQIVSAKARAEVSSLNTRNALRDQGLRSPLFLDAAKFPQAAFESTKIEGDQMTGVLTIKGISKPVTLTVVFKNGVLTAQGSFNRNDFGISYNQELLHHQKAIGDKIDLIVELKGK